jgi:hypothetical protein
MLLHSADEHLDELKAAKCVILLSYSSEPLFFTQLHSADEHLDELKAAKCVILLSYSSEPLFFPCLHTSAYVSIRGAGRAQGRQMCHPPILLLRASLARRCTYQGTYEA